MKHSSETLQHSSKSILMFIFSVILEFVERSNMLNLVIQTGEIAYDSIKVNSNLWNWKDNVMWNWLLCGNR